MKKLLIFGGLLLVTGVSLATETLTIIAPSTGVECPNGCETSASKCCTTKGGSTYYGKL